MLRYKVSISYHYFLFDNIGDACSFAQMAKSHYFDKDDKNVSVEITLVDEDEYNKMINKMED